MAYITKADIKAVAELVWDIGKWLWRGGKPMEPFEYLEGEIWKGPHENMSDKEFIMGGHKWDQLDTGQTQCQQCMLLDDEVDDLDEQCPLGKKVNLKDLANEKLIILSLTYRAQLEYVLDNFVSTENVPTGFWMEIMDTYAAQQVIDNDTEAE